PAKVEVEDRVPLLRAHPEQEVVARDPGVVDKDVEPAVAERERRLHDFFGRSIGGDVALDEDRRAAGLLDEMLRLLGGGRVALVVDRDPRAFAAEAGGGRATDAASCAGDERGPTLEVHAS